MIRINLLPIKQLKKRQRLKNEVILFGIGLFCLLVVLGLVGMSQAKRIVKLKAESAALTAEKQQYQAIIAQIEKIKNDQLLLETKLGVIKSLKVNSQLSVRVLDEIANITPTSRLWITSLNVASGKVSLAGTALDNATIANFMDDLDASPFFSNTELSSSAMVTIANQRLKSFGLTINVNQPTSNESAEL